MVARLFRIRLALLGGNFRGSVGTGLRAALFLILAGIAAVALAWAPTVLTADPEALAVLDVLVGALVLVAVLCVPFFENRRNLEPRQFAQYPASSGSVAFALFLTTVVSWPFFVFVVWLASLAVLRPTWGAAGWIAPVALVLVAVFAIAAVRVVSALSKLVAGRRYAGAMRMIGALLLVAILPVAVFAGANALGEHGADLLGDAADTVALTPFGAPFAAIVAAANGDQDAALLRLLLLAAGIVVLLAVWFPLVAVSNSRIERPLAPGIARSGLGWFERFSAKPSRVIAARQLTYWARDPRYRVALFAIPIAPVAMLLAFWVAGADLHPLAIVPLPIILLLLGWSQHNDVAMDSTAIWAHVASGTKGRADRVGRLAPVMFIGIPLALIGSSITVTLLGDWRVLPSVIGMNLAVLFVASAVSCVFSVMMPYPATRPGDSPFMQPQWSGSGSGLAQTLSMVLAIVLSLPPVWFAVQAIVDVEFMQNIWALIGCTLYGLVVLALGVLLGGWLFDRSGPELIAVTQVFD